MIASTAAIATYSARVEQHLPVARAIASRLKRRYWWLHSEDLYSYALLGLTLAARSWRSGRRPSFGAYAGYKAMFLAIDAMRRDRVLPCGASGRPRERARSWQSGRDGGPRCEPVDPHGQDAERRVGIRDMVDHLLCHLRATDRKMLAMYYTGGMTFAEIGEISGVAGSTIGVRHAAVLKTLRRQAEMGTQRHQEERHL